MNATTTRCLMFRKHIAGPIVLAAVAIIFMQVPVMLVRGAGFGLLPLGMVLLAVLCMPPILLAGAAARARLRREGG